MVQVAYYDTTHCSIHHDNIPWGIGLSSRVSRVRDDNRNQFGAVISNKSRDS